MFVMSVKEISQLIAMSESPHPRDKQGKKQVAMSTTPELSELTKDLEMRAAVQRSRAERC